MAGLEIIIPTNFNNPLLSKVPVYGFKDNFNRADSSTFGVTSGEVKSWERLHGLSVYGGRVLGNRARPIADGAAGAWAAEVVDAQTPNGTLRATLAVAGSQWGGLAFRAKSAPDFLYLSLRATSTSARLVLQKKIGSTTILVASSSLTDLATDGSVFEVVLSGSNATVNCHGATVIPTQAIPEHATATKHGLYLQGLSADLAWDDVEFIPA